MNIPKPNLKAAKARADAATAKMTAAMEPLMIIIMAVVVGLIIAACGAPILSMSSSIL